MKAVILSETPAKNWFCGIKGARQGKDSFFSELAAQFRLKFSRHYDIITTEGEVMAYQNPENPLYGNRLVTYGTSITFGFGAATDYGKEIAARNAMKHTNYAVGGYSAVQTYHVYASRRSLPEMKGLTEKDYVVFEGMFNNKKLVLGVITADGTEDFDASTVYGALEQTIWDYQHSECRAKLGYVLTHYSAPAREDPALLADVWDAAADVCGKYRVPLLDLRNKDYELTSDGVHLTDAGQIAMSYDVEAWLKAI